MTSTEGKGGNHAGCSRNVACTVDGHRFHIDKGTGTMNFNHEVRSLPGTTATSLCTVIELVLRLLLWYSSSWYLTIIAIVYGSSV